MKRSFIFFVLFQSISWSQGQLPPFVEPEISYTQPKKYEITLNNGSKKMVTFNEFIILVSMNYFGNDPSTNHCPVCPIKENNYTLQEQFEKDFQNIDKIKNHEGFIKKYMPLFKSDQWTNGNKGTVNPEKDNNG